MGCDIHFSIEVRSSVRESDMVKDVDKIRKDKLTFKEYYQKYSNDKIWRVYFIDSSNAQNALYKTFGFMNSDDVDYALGRNYNLFALLANVRGTNSKCISEDRGIPKDVSDEVKFYYEKIWKNDGHSASWITLEEFMSFGKEYLDEEIGTYYWINIVEPLLRLNKAPKNIRFVFWFDN